MANTKRCPACNGTMRRNAAGTHWWCKCGKRIPISLPKGYKKVRR